MSKNTVKPGLTRKRAKRQVENPQYIAFARRILAAYARRVASGDVEALRDLVLLPAEVDSITRTAVTGLRRFGYSWQEIADRLGVTKQAAQMRYAERTERGALDRRLLAAGQSVTVAELVEMFTDHHPGLPADTTCPACRYQYQPGEFDCPTNVVVRPLLRRRYHEDKQATSRLTYPQTADLLDLADARAIRARHARQSRRPAGSAPRPDQPANLLDQLVGQDVTP